jgi:hypothetical protein
MLNLFCPVSACFKSYLICIYSCPRSRVKSCKEYSSQYQAVIAQTIPDHYLARYGPPIIFDPSIKPRKTLNKIKELTQPDPVIELKVKPQKKRKKKPAEKVKKEPQEKVKSTESKAKKRHKGTAR